MKVNLEMDVTCTEDDVSGVTKQCLCFTNDIKTVSCHDRK